MKKNPRKIPLAEWQLEDSQRLKALYNQKRAELGLTQEKIASELGEGVTQGAVSHFMNGRTALSLRAASVFAKALKVPVSEFSPRLARELEEMRAVPVDGSPELREVIGPQSAATPLPDGSENDGLDGRYAYVPQYDAKAAAGLGSENPHVEIRSTLAFKREWLRVKLSLIHI